jgi:arsenical pump membrane protein
VDRQRLVSFEDLESTPEPRAEPREVGTLGSAIYAGRGPGSVVTGTVLLAVAALGMAAAAAAADPTGAWGATRQDWSPFVLVAGLLLIGLVADGDGFFAAVGGILARAVKSDLALYAGATAMVAAVTAVLNLDTAVAFLTPVLVHLARARSDRAAPLVYGCLFVSNAASVLLPGSNLTNLIVLGHLHLSGGTFAARMAPSFLASVIVTSVVVAVVCRRRNARDRDLLAAPSAPSARSAPSAPSAPSTPSAVAANSARRSGRAAASEAGVGLVGPAAVILAAVLVVSLHSPAPWVAAVGVTATCVRLVQRRHTLSKVIEVLGPAVLVGLFAIAVALGTLGRAWSGPAALLRHLDPWATAAVAAVGSVLTNNLPAASLLAARVPPHPYSLLIGLDLGPNLFVTGSLSAVLWMRAARSAGARISVREVAVTGAVAVPLSIAAAMAALGATGLR